MQPDIFVVYDIYPSVSIFSIHMMHIYIYHIIYLYIPLLLCFSKTQVGRRLYKESQTVVDPEQKFSVGLGLVSQ